MVIGAGGHTFLLHRTRANYEGLGVNEINHPKTNTQTAQIGGCREVRFPLILDNSR